MIDYLFLKAVHVACAGLSYALFFVRGIWMIREPALLERRWVRIVPHVNDTLLLAAAIAMTVMTGQYPFVHGWLTAKLIALVIYIGLGMIALTRGKTREVRVAAWVGAQLAFGYIVAVALTRDPLPLPS